MAKKTTGSIWAWGNNANGQLGDNTTIAKLAPTQVGTSTTWRAISVGFDFAIATSNPSTFFNNLSSWGRNQGGQLGDATFVEKRMPSLINSCNVLVLDNESFSKNHFKIYPNPANDVLNIQNKENIQIEKIKIVNLLGETVLTETSNFNTINIEKLATGMYILEVITYEKISNYEFIKQ